MIINKYSWNRGSIASNNGINATGSTRIRTGYISPPPLSVAVANGYKYAVYVYNESQTYQGIYNGTEFVKQVAWQTEALTLSGVIPSDYYVRFLVATTSDSSITAASAGDKLMVEISGDVASAGSEVRYPRWLNGDGAEKRRIVPSNLSLTLLKNDVSTAHIGVPEGDELPAVLDWVEMYTLKGSAGLFRVYQTETPASGNAGCDLRHGVCTLHDSVWNNRQDEDGNLLDTEFEGTVAEYVAAILSHQRTVYWQMGVCADEGNWKKSGLNHDHLDDLLFELMRERDGYMLSYDFSTSPWTLSIVACGQEIEAECRASRNLKDGRHRFSRDGMVNRLYLSVHEKVKKDTEPEIWSGGPNAGEETGLVTAEEDKTTETETTLHLFNETDSQAIYGILEGASDVDMADVPDSLNAWVAAYFRDHAWPIQQASMDGYEIVKSTGEPWDQFDLGKKARIALRREGFPAEGPIEQIRYADLLNEPEKAHVELTRKLPGLAERLSGIKSAADAASRAASGAGYGAAQAKEVTHWAQVVQHIQELIEGTGVKEMWETGIEMDAEQGLTIYSLYDGLDWSMATLRVTNSSIEALVQDMTGLHSEIVMTSSMIYSAVANSQSTLYSYITQTASGIYSEIGSAESGLYSSISQTAEEIRAEVWAADSAMYSFVSLTASSLHTEIGNATSDLYSSITQTAEEIRADVVAAGSSLYSYVSLTASSLHAEIGNAESDMYTSITQTASDIRAEVVAASSTLYAYVDLSVSGLRTQVVDIASELYSEIAQSASQIALKVSAGDVATQLAVEVGNVSITGGNLVVDGMITSSSLATEIAGLGQVDINGYLNCNGFAIFDEDVTFNDSVVGPGAQFETLLFGSGGAYDVMDAVSSIGPASASGGQISIPYDTFRQAGAGSINFNIADTQFYQDGVSAAYVDGWDDVTVDSLTFTNLYNPANNTRFITGTATAANGQDISRQLQIVETEPYNAGAGSVTVVTMAASSAAFDTVENEYTIPVTAYLSNQATGSDSITLAGPTVYSAMATSWTTNLSGNYVVWLRIQLSNGWVDTDAYVVHGP